MFWRGSWSQEGWSVQFTTAHFSPLISFKIDWLHNMDLGVSCDAIRKCMLVFALQLPRKSGQPSGCPIPENQRFLCQEWQPTQSPELKTRAAKTRVLVPWALWNLLRAFESIMKQEFVWLQDIWWNLTNVWAEIPLRQDICRICVSNCWCISSEVWLSNFLWQQ